MVPAEKIEIFGSCYQCEDFAIIDLPSLRDFVMRDCMVAKDSCILPQLFAPLGLGDIDNVRDEE